MGPELVASSVNVSGASASDALGAALSPDAPDLNAYRARSQALRSRYPHANEILTLFEALLDAWSAPDIRRGALRERVGNRAALATYAAESVMPLVIDATVAHGPKRLAAAVSERFVKANLVDIAARWLVDEELLPLDRYLARASLQPLLETRAQQAGTTSPAENASVADELFERATDDLHCPRCNGLPQLSYFEVSGEALVTGPRRLLCARCSHAWTGQRMTCAQCGEQTSAQLPVFGEKETFPHIRVDACESCKHFLLTIDLKKDQRAVPLVDELAALPLDLYAQERGYTKIVPNLMGN